MEQRVGGILPALVAHTAGGALRILDEAVVVRIAIAVDPGQRAEQGGQKFDEQILVVEPVHHFDGADQEQRRAIDGPVVGRVRNQLEIGELAVASLMQNLAGLLLAGRVDLLALVPGQVA